MTSFPLGGIALLDSLFAAAALESAASAVQRSALTAIAAHLDDSLPEDFVSAFRDRRDDFEAAVVGRSGYHQPQWIVANQLSPAIRNLPDDVWARLAERLRGSGPMRDLDLETHLVQPAQGWKPEISLLGTDAASVEKVGDLIPGLLDGLMKVSLLERSKLPYDIALTGLLDAPKARFAVQTLPPDFRDILRVYWKEDRNHCPFIGIEVRKDLPLDAALLAYGVSLASHRGVCSLNERQFKNLEKCFGPSPTPGFRDYLLSLRKNMAGLGNQAQTPASIAVQEAMLLGRSQDILRKVWEKMAENIPVDVERLLKAVRHFSFRLMVTSRDASTPLRVSTWERSAPMKKTLVGDRRRNGKLSVLLHASPEEMASFTEEDFWTLIAHSLSIWVGKGRRMGKEEIFMDVRTPSKKLSNEAVVLHADPEQCRFPAGSDHVRLQELSDLLRWMGALGDDPYNTPYPGLSAVRTALGKDRLSEVFRFPWPVEAIRVSPQRGESPLFSYEQRWRRFAVFLEAPLERLLSIPPMDLIESIAAHLERRRENVFDPEKSVLHVPADAPVWAWSRLFWKYERMLLQPSQAKGELAIVGDEPMERAAIEGLIPALGELSDAEVDEFGRSMENAPNWIFEYDKTLWQIPKGELVLKKATTLSVLSVPNAKLIRFDGFPDMGPAEWLAVARFVVGGRGDQDSEETLRTVSLNAAEERTAVDPYDNETEAYGAATAEEKQRYRVALQELIVFAGSQGMQGPRNLADPSQLRLFARNIAFHFNADKRPELASRYALISGHIKIVTQMNAPSAKAGGVHRR